MRILTLQDLANASEGDRLVARKKIASLTRSYTDMLAAQQAGKEVARPPGVHASEIKCIRRVVYNLVDEAQVRDANLKWVMRFKMGHLIHDFLQKDFHKLARYLGYKVTFLDEVPIKPEYQELARMFEVYSSCDGVFTFHEEAGTGEYLRCGLEIKSISSADYDALREPTEDHLDQIHLYMACLNLAFVWVLYFNKGNQEYTKSDMPPFVVEFDPNRWARIEGDIRRAHKHAAQGTLPDRTEGFHCGFCPFSKSCKPPSMFAPEVDKPTQILQLGRRPVSKRR